MKPLTRARSSWHASQSAYALGEYAALVDVGHNEDRTITVVRDGHVHEVTIAEVDLGTRACALSHDEVVAGLQPVEGSVPERPPLLGSGTAAK